MKEGSRIYQAVEMAGGLTENAAGDFLNMAGKLEDGMKIQIPDREEAVQWSREAAAYPGKRYRRQDEVGTPFCITYDFDSVEDHCVTVRDRDTMEQVRMPIAELVPYLKEKMEF